MPVNLSRSEAAALGIDTRKGRKSSNTSYPKLPCGTTLECALETRLKELKFPDWERNFSTWCPGRKLEFDFAWEYVVTRDNDGFMVNRRVMVACECQGRDHQRNQTYHEDVEKWAIAASLGWRILPVTTQWLQNDPGSFLDLLRKALGIE